MPLGATPSGLLSDLEPVASIRLNSTYGDFPGAVARRRVSAKTTARGDRGAPDFGA